MIRDGNEIFVLEGRDEVKGETFYRPLGGAIEFGELASNAVRRELMEELGVDVAEARLLTVLENVFTYQGRLGHEVDFVFEVTLAEPARLRSGAVEAYEANGERIVCMWKPIADFRNGSPLYPEGLLALLS